MRAAKYLPHYTVADYRHWEGDWELIEGIPYAMSPSPVRKHQRLGVAIMGQIREQLKQHRECGVCDLVYDLDWVVVDDTVLRPDIAIICNQQGDFITAPPALIIEIISPSTAIKDRQLKYEIYEKQGVHYYILVNPENNTASAFVLKGSSYVESETREFTIHGDCKIRIDFEQAFAESV